MSYSISRIIHVSQDKDYRNCLKHITLGVFIIIFSYQLNIHSDLSKIYTDISRISIPPKNFTNHYKIYKELKKKEVPIFIINRIRWEDYIPRVYFYFIDNKGWYGSYKFGCQVVAGNGGETTPEHGRELLSDFIRKNPYGLVVLAQIGIKELNNVPFSDKIEIIKSGERCILVLSNMLTVDEVGSIAKSLDINFPLDIFNAK